MFHENGPVQSVAKALRLLGLLMEVHQPLTLAALSKQTGWPKSTIHGLLSAVVDQQSDGRYCLGVRLFEYGRKLERFRPGKAAFAAFGKRDRAVGVPLDVESVRGHHHRTGAVPRGTARRVGGRDASAAALHLAGQGVSIRDG